MVMPSRTGANLGLRPRSLDSGRGGGMQSSLIKTDTFNDQNHDLEASGSEGSFDRLSGATLVSGQSRPAASSFLLTLGLVSVDLSEYYILVSNMSTKGHA
jgi:hypothetical protein